MKIVCYDLTKFLDIIGELVVRGLQFNADADTLVITLTGGY